MNVFELTCLVPKIDAKLQSLVSWQENVYVGTDDGHILLYKLAERKDENNNSTFSYILDKKKHLGHGKKSVDKILIFADLMKLVTLVDGNVDILNAYSLENSISIPQNKGVSLICLEKRSLLYRLCLQVKKKLIFYEFVGSFQLFKEITLPEPAVSLEWYKDTLCIGFKREYILQNIDTNEVTQLFPLDPKQIPVVRLLDDDILIAKDELGVFITETGQPTRGNVLWNSIPIDVVYRSPYIIAIEPKSKLIEIHNFLNQNLTQTISFPGKDFKVASCYEGSKFVLIGSNSEIYCLNEMSLEMQVQNLLEKGKINDAVELVENSCAREPREVAVKRRNRVHADAGLVLYKNLDIDAAYEHFMQSDIDPRILIESLPNVAPTDWSFKSSHPIILPSLVENRHDKAILIKSAKKHLLKFLERKMTYQFKKEVNTARLKLYLILDDSELAAPKGVLLESLLKSTTDYFNSETESKLQDHKQYHALGLFYKNNQEYKKALDIWQKLGNKTLVDANFDGISSTVALLSSLDISQSYANLQLIWEYSKWVLTTDPERGIKIFASKLRPIEIPPKQVLEYLTPFGNHLVQLYLEFLIHDCKIQDPDFHTRLCLIYIESIKSSILGTNPIPGIEMLRNKFISMLETSAVYSENTVLAQIVNLPLYEELLILYTRLRKYSKALEILVVNICDFVRAENYCSKYKEEDPDLMLSLLKVYLSQKVPEKILSDVTVEFLNKHASELSLENVLSVLPKDVPINMLQGFLSKSLRYHQHTLKSQSIVKNILKSEVITLKGELGDMTQRSVVITRDKMCPVCGKPLGDRVFAYFPNGTVVHFKCFKDATIDPVTGFDFKKHGEKLFEQ